MVAKVDTAVIKLWGEEVGAVSWLEERSFAVFEYDPDFLKKGLNIAPLHMGLADARAGDSIFSFPGLNKETYLGLPGLLADSLPDKFGNSIIDAWLARNGRDAGGFSPVERLCYTGRRGMGALEFAPPVNRRFDDPVPVAVSRLVELTQAVMSRRLDLAVEIGTSEKHNAEAMLDILRVGTSAGGARPKAVIAMDEEGHVMSGQSEVPPGYDYWILKFDGVDDLELGPPKGYGRIEYAYFLMAVSAGIEMAQCRLLEENGRAHFMTRRFDRQNGQKIHLQSLCGIAHFDFNMAGAYSYEQAFGVMRRLRLTRAEATQQYRRMVFNLIARNQDDHTKNIAFLMDRDGQWKLSPAYDVTYSHNSAGKWTHQHQMSVNGKQGNFVLEDLLRVGRLINISKPLDIISQVVGTVKKWPDFAREAGVSEDHIKQIGQYHRMGLR